MSNIEAENGHSRIKLAYRHELTNPHGSLHGGAIVSLADTAMAVAVASRYPEEKFYTAKLEIKFKSPADKTDIFAEAKVSGKKRDFIFGDIKIKGSDGKLIATATTVFYLIKNNAQDSGGLKG